MMSASRCSPEWLRSRWRRRGRRCRSPPPRARTDGAERGRRRRPGAAADPTVCTAAKCVHRIARGELDRVASDGSDRTRFGRRRPGTRSALWIALRHLAKPLGGLARQHLFSAPARCWAGTSAGHVGGGALQHGHRGRAEAIQGTSVMAVAPLPMTTASWCNRGHPARTGDGRRLPAKFSRPGNSGV